MSDRYRIEHGDCLALLKREPANSWDAFVTDPPGAIGFMSRDWDKDKGGRKEWTRYWSKRFAAALRVMKPGAHGFVWALPRTSHMTGWALADAGFEIRDAISHAFGSGMPKSHNLPGGLGTALKPSHEIWFLVRKPLEKGLTIAQNVAKWGTGALNIDAGRVAHAGAADRAAHDAQVAAIKARGGSMEGSWKNSSDLSGANDVNDAGRWPPNLLLSHSGGCRRVGTREVKANPTWDTPNRDTKPSSFTGETVSPVKHGGETEGVPVWECRDDCPVRLMDGQSGERPSGHFPQRRTPNGIYGSGNGTSLDQQGGERTLSGDGTASRFFPQFELTELDDLEPFIYMSKASRAERDVGLDHFKRAGAQPNVPNPNGVDAGVRNTHPCLTPDSLVVTANGLKPISTVKLGEAVLAADGRFHQAVDVSHHNGASRIFEISVDGTNMAVGATAEHPFLIYRPTKKRNSIVGYDISWRKTAELRVGDYTLTPLHRSQASADLDQPNLDYWFVVGLWLAEGSVHSAKSSRYACWTLHSKETDLVARITSVFPETKTYKHGKNGILAIAIRHQSADEFIRLCGKLARGKSLHPSVFDLPESARRALLEGYVAGDGARVRGVWSCKTVSPSLASQIPLLAESVGYHAAMFYNEPQSPRLIEGREVTGGPFYQLYLKPSPAKSRGPRIVVHDGGAFSLRRIKQIVEKPYSGMVWNLTVEGSHTFQTVVGMSHNTVKSVELARYLVKMVALRTGEARPRVGDICMGSGTIGVASILEGCDFTGFELNDTDEEPFFSISKARLEHALGYTYVPRESLRTSAPPAQRGLFDNRETA